MSPQIPDSEHLIESLIHASKRLKELSFIYNNGKISIIEDLEQDQEESDII